MRADWLITPKLYQQPDSSLASCGTQAPPRHALSLAPPHLTPLPGPAPPHPSPWPRPHHTLSLADDEKVLVDPACGATLAAVYSHVVQKLQREGKLCAPLSSLVVIVCGGSNISLAQLRALKKQLGMKNGLPK